MGKDDIDVNWGKTGRRGVPQREKDAPKEGGLAPTTQPNFIHLFPTTIPNLSLLSPQPFHSSFFTSGYSYPISC